MDGRVTETAPHKPTVRPLIDPSSAMVLCLIVMMVAGLLWGLKLEARIDQEQQLLRAVEVQAHDVSRELAKGILPVTQERITRLGQELASLVVGMQDLRTAVDRIEIGMEHLRVMQAKQDLEMTKGRRNR